MNEKFSFTIEERHGNMIAKIECSEFYNHMLETGETEYLLQLFNETISMLSMRIRNNRCSEPFTEKEEDLLALVSSLIYEE